MEIQRKIKKGETLVDLKKELDIPEKFRKE